MFENFAASNRFSPGLNEADPMKGGSIHRPTEALGLTRSESPANEMPI